jgi:hypothetical protein
VCQRGYPPGTWYSPPQYVSVTAWLETDDDRKLCDIIEAALATLRATLDA